MRKSPAWLAPSHFPIDVYAALSIHVHYGKVEWSGCQGNEHMMHVRHREIIMRLLQAPRAGWAGVVGWGGC